jgi:hypothetical protein
MKPRRNHSRNQKRNRETIPLRGGETVSALTRAAIRHRVATLAPVLATPYVCAHRRSPRQHQHCRSAAPSARPNSRPAASANSTTGSNAKGWNWLFGDLCVLAPQIRRLRITRGARGQDHARSRWALTIGWAQTRVWRRGRPSNCLDGIREIVASVLHPRANPPTRPRMGIAGCPDLCVLSNCWRAVRRCQGQWRPLWSRRGYPGNRALAKFRPCCLGTRRPFKTFVHHNVPQVVHIDDKS